MTVHGRTPPVSRAREADWWATANAHAAAVTERTADLGLARFRAGGKRMLANTTLHIEPVWPHLPKWERYAIRN